MEFHPPRPAVREAFAARHTIPSEINRLSKPPEPTFSQSFTPTATVSLTTCDDFTTWSSTSVGSRGASWQNGHGQKFAVKPNEQSLQTNMQQSSLQKKISNAAL